MLGLGLLIPQRDQGGGSAAYNPVIALGSDLLGYWDANPAYWGNNGGVTDDGAGLISSWRDVIAAYALTGATTARPTYGATSFNGTPGLAFDGVANTLTLTLSGQFPAAALPSELWALGTQTALVADTGGRVALAYGNTTGNNARQVARVVVTAANRGRATTGDGAASSIATGTTADLSGSCVLRSQIGATTTMLTVNGTDTASVAVVPGTSATRIRAGATAPAGATAFWQGQLVALMVTQPLSAAKASALQTWMLTRAGLA